MSNKLEITSIRFYRPKGLKENILSLCDVVLGDSIAIKGIRLIDGPKGKFLGMPSRKNGDRFTDIVYPINKDMRDYMTKTVLDQFSKTEQPATTTASQDDDLPF